MEKYLGGEDITGAQDTAAQHGSAAVRKPCDADACQVFAFGKIRRGEAVQAAAFHLSGHGGQHQTAEAKNRQGDGKNTSEHCHTSRIWFAQVLFAAAGKIIQSSAEGITGNPVILSEAPAESKNLIFAKGNILPRSDPSNRRERLPQDDATEGNE